MAFPDRNCEAATTGAIAWFILKAAKAKMTDKADG